MDGSRPSERKRVAGPRRPHDDSFFAAKVDGIMRIAGFVRGEDGSWHKPDITAATVGAAGGNATAGPSKGI
jgi:hypothetical protein